jgi:hypothetical protein
MTRLEKRVARVEKVKRAAAAKTASVSQILKSAYQLHVRDKITKVAVARALGR